MAHHLAELINASENGETEDDCLRAKENAMETILKLWEIRAALPGNAYPLAAYRDILKILDRLRIDDSSFLFLIDRFNGEMKSFAAKIFKELSLLIGVVLLMHISSQDQSVTVNISVEKALDKSERELLTALNHWKESVLFSASFSETSGSAIESNPESIAIQLIDSITTDLEGLRRTFLNTA